MFTKCLCVFGVVVEMVLRGQRLAAVVVVDLRREF